jgi:hypothetical protein
MALGRHSDSFRRRRRRSTCRILSASITTAVCKKGATGSSPGNVTVPDACRGGVLETHDIKHLLVVPERGEQRPRDRREKFIV